MLSFLLYLFTANYNLRANYSDETNSSIEEDNDELIEWLSEYTLRHYDKIHTDMMMNEVENLLGPGIILIPRNRIQRAYYFCDNNIINEKCFILIIDYEDYVVKKITKAMILVSDLKIITKILSEYDESLYNRFTNFISALKELYLRGRFYLYSLLFSKVPEDIDDD